MLRSVIDSLDVRCTMYVADVTGKRPLHQAAYAAHLTEQVDASFAEDKAAFLLRHGLAVVKVRSPSPDLEAPPPLPPHRSGCPAHDLT